MRIAVLGTSHLGTVTGACLAHLGHTVVQVDDGDSAAVSAAVLTEPRLDEMMSTGRASGRLTSADLATAAGGAEVVWIAEDTPLDDSGRPESDRVLVRAEDALRHAAVGALVIVSSQLVAGSCGRLQRWADEHLADRRLEVACVPENLRLGTAVTAFLSPERVVVGVRPTARRDDLVSLFEFAGSILWMSVESAEMTKHALNGFLAMSIAFTNEIAALCALVGADASEVEAGLRSDARVGPRAYLRAGEPFSGGTLARDLEALRGLADNNGVAAHLLEATTRSNAAHATWAIEQLVDYHGVIDGLTITMLGLSYKAGTGEADRSWSAVCVNELTERGATIQAYDPTAVSTDDLAPGVVLFPDVAGALTDADAAIVATPWPEFARLVAVDVVGTMRTPLIIDITGTTPTSLASDRRITQIVFGRAPLGDLPNGPC